MSDEKKIQLGLNMSFVVRGDESDFDILTLDLEVFKDDILDLLKRKFHEKIKPTVISKQEYIINE